MIAHQHLNRQAFRQRRIQEAEENAAAKTAGWDTSVLGEDDEMGITILGDATFSDDHRRPASEGMGTLAKMATAGVVAALAGTGVGLPLALPAILEAVQAPAVESQEPVLPSSGFEDTIGFLETDK